MRQLGSAAKSGVRQLGSGRDEQNAHDPASLAAPYAKKSVQSAVKVTQTTVKAARKAQQAVKQAQKIVKKTYKAAKTTVKTTIKLVKLTAKAVAAAAKAFYAFLAAGGWIVVVVLLLLLAVVLLFASPASVTVMEPDSRYRVRAILEDEYEKVEAVVISRFKEEQKTYRERGYDYCAYAFVGDADGDSELAANTLEILIVYATYVTMNPDYMLTAAMMEPEQEQVLREVFQKMVSVSVRTYTREVKEIRKVKQEDGSERAEEVVVRTLMVEGNVKCMTAEEAYTAFGFTEEMIQFAEELFQPPHINEILSMFGDGTSAELSAALVGVTGNDLASQVVLKAATKVGSPYVMGAKGPTKFDCSGLVKWSIYEIDPVLGKPFGVAACNQARHCYKQKCVVWAHSSIAAGYPATYNLDDLQVGDVIFWRKNSCSCGRWEEIHHTGFYIGDGMILDASSSNGRVVIRKLWSSGGWRIVMFARPYVLAAQPTASPYVPTPAAG